MSPEQVAEEVGLSCGSEILTAGLGACRIQGVTGGTDQTSGGCSLC